MLAVKPGSSVPSGEISRWMRFRDNTDDQAWDRPLDYRATHRGRDMESWWCWAVGATMINRFYGGTITRDEVVYKVKRELLHDGDAGAGWDECKTALKYVLNCNDAQLNDPGAKPSEITIKNWIDAGRPIYSSKPAHIMVIRGYKYQGGKFYVEHVNRDNNGQVDWDEWSTHALHAGICICCPTSGLSGISRDARVGQDSDGDGVNNFDEQVRFQPGKLFPSHKKWFFFEEGKGTDSGKSDSDGDGINDKNEIASYVFPTNILNGGAISTGKFPPQDGDGDWLCPPVDEDSDNGGIKDGEEDKDHDGLRDAGEGDIFDPKDDKSLDLVFCIDNTGSMGDDIDAVKVQAINILNKIGDEFPNWRVAVVGCKDHPVDPYGEPGDWLYQDFIGFSTNKVVIAAAINSMGADGGADLDEAVYSGIMHCINGSSLGGWRKDPVKRKILVMGDAPPHDPEPFTGYTLASVSAAASAGGVVWEEAYGGKGTKGGDDELSGPIGGVMLVIGGDLDAQDFFERIAEEMDGDYIEAGSASEVPGAVMDAIETMSTAPSVVLEVSGNYGDTNILADVARSVDPLGCGIAMCEWDWDGDGTYDETNYSPVISHVYPSGFGGKMRVRVTAVLGETGTSTYQLLIPEFIDVTQYVEEQTLASHLDKSTGAIVCDIVLGNKTTTIKTMKDKFYFALPRTATMFLANPDGTLADGTPYKDITALVEGALPTVGDGDGELDPGETVRLEDAIEIYSRDRSMPVGFVIAVWADPPPGVAAIHYPAKVGDARDKNDDFVIDDFEVLDAVDNWSTGQVDDFGLLETIEFWKAGGYRWDAAEGKFVPVR